MNIKDWLDDNWKPNPSKFTAQRILHKTWININSEDFNLLWVQWFKKRWFFNVVYLWIVDWIKADENKKSNYSLISINEVWKYITQDNPGWSWLLLALSKPYFKKYGWWAERVKEEMEKLKRITN